MAGANWRVVWIALAAIALAVLGGTFAALTAVHARSSWVLSGTAVAAATVTAVGAVLRDRYKRRAREHDNQAMQIRSGCLVINGHLPKVRKVSNPVWLGAHTAPSTNRSSSAPSKQGTSETPPYIPRDCDDLLHKLLTHSGFILLVGNSTSGKSRTLYEAMVATVPTHTLIAPQDTDALQAALLRASTTRKCVLWLDDLEKYLVGGGLSAYQIASLLAGDGHHRLILATMRLAEEGRFVEDRACPGEIQKEARGILEQARKSRIMLPRLFSDSERRRAKTRIGDPRIAHALANADTYGIAEHLAAGPELLCEWENARNSSESLHARGAALVASAVDIRRAGYVSAIPRSLIEQVHHYYLSDSEHIRIPLESLADAWAWATKPRRATASLLRLAKEDSVGVFDYLVDSIQNPGGHSGPVPEAVVRAAIDAATTTNADSMAATAYTQGRFELAQYGWLRAWQVSLDSSDRGPHHPDTLSMRSCRAIALDELGRLRDAEAEHRTVLAERVRVLGPTHLDTLASRNNIASVLHSCGRLGEAETEYCAVLEALTQKFGQDHIGTLICRSNRAQVLQALGRLDEAESEHRAVLEARIRVLGVEHTDTLVSRQGLASVLRQRGRLSEAKAEHRAVLQAFIRVLGPEHPNTLLSRFQLGIDYNELGRLEEAEDELRIALGAFARLLSSDHPQIAGVRTNLARVLRMRGRYEEAEAEHRAAIETFARTLGPDHPDTLISRSYHARALTDLGRRGEAEAEHRAVLKARVRVLGPNHPDTLASRTDLGKLLGPSGRSNAA